MIKSKKILSTLLIGIVSLGLIACSPSQTNTSTSKTINLADKFDFDGYYGNDEEVKTIAKTLIGKEASNIKMKTINGTSFDLNSYKGQNVIIEIADTTCSECIKTIPEVIEFEKQYKDYKVFKIFSDDKSEDIRELYKTKGFELDGATVIAGSDNVSTNHVDKDYNIQFVPTFIFVNKDGIISSLDIGGTNVETLKSHADIAFN